MRLLNTRTRTADKLSRKCPECGSLILWDATTGHCPGCLLALGDDHEDDEAYPTFNLRARQVGDYVLGRQLGSGGMGVVYEAQQASLHRKVAIKLIRDSQVASPTLLRRFMTEAEAAARLSHPNIVAIHEIGELDGQPYFSMEFIEGENLRAKLAKDEFAFKCDADWHSAVSPTGNRRYHALKRNERSENRRDVQMRIAGLMAKTARAVHHAHQRGVVHRDIKPSNILIDPQGEPHLMDFGVAKILLETADEPPQSSLTLPGDIVGTLTYMSPEQAASGVSTCASDIYGLGAVLYEVLTRQPPFRGHTPVETLKLVQEQEATRPRAINPLIERDLETICLKCLQKNPSHRYASAQTLAEDLENWICHRPIMARPSGPVRRATQWMKRNPVGTAFIATLCLGLFIALVQQYNVSRQKTEIDLRQAMLFDESIERIQRAWGDSNITELIIASKYLAILDNRSPNYEAKGPSISLGVSIQGDPVSFASERAKLFGQLEASMSQSLGEPVVLDLKLFKKTGRDAQILAEGQADVMVVNPAVYLKAKARNPGIIPIARENKIAHGVIVTSTRSGVTRLPQLVGKSIGFPAVNDPLTVWARSRLVDAGVFAKDLGFVTNFVRGPEFPDTIRHQLNRQDSATCVHVLNGWLVAGVTAARRFELEKHRGLIKLGDLPDTPNIFAARPNLPPKVVAAFRTALLRAPAKLSPTPTENFEWEGAFRGASAIDDSYFDAFREALRKASRFEGGPIQPP